MNLALGVHPFHILDMRSNRSIPEATVIPELAYTDLAAAVRWLGDAFGFQERLRIADHRVQLVVGGGAVVALGTSRDAGAAEAMSRHGVLVRVTDVDAHFARAKAAGAEVLSPPTTYPFGERQYSARDPGGHRWTFSETVDDVDPATWG